MKLLQILAVILSVCSLSYAAVSIGFYKDPAHPGKCVYQNLVLLAGEEAKLPNACARILCEEDSFATIQTCGVMAPPPGCKFTNYINIDAPYAECCAKELVCA